MYISCPTTAFEIDVYSVCHCVCRCMFCSTCSVLSLSMFVYFQVVSGLIALRSFAQHHSLRFLSQLCLDFQITGNATLRSLVSR